MAAVVGKELFDEVLRDMDIADIDLATIRQMGAIGGALERRSGKEFIHLEIGVPGLPPEKVGVDAEIAALQSGVASIYPSIQGTESFKNESSRFIKAFLNVDVSPVGCFPTVGSMQGAMCLYQVCTQREAGKDTILFIDPGFPVQRLQAKILGIKQASFDIYNYRAEKLGPKMEEYLAKGNVAAIIYSNPNNPAWVCLTESELKTIGELATKYDTIVLEDLAYMGMDFRKELGHPFAEPYQPSVARYTDNYILMISGSKIFSYAGQRIAVAAISDKLYSRNFPALKENYGIGRFGDSFALTFLYAASSGTSHSAQYALAAMFKAAADGELDFVGHTSEYARRAGLIKELFVKNGFHIVYDKDLDEDVSHGFFFTAGYGAMKGTELVAELMRYGICAISLSTTGSRQNGARICVSMMNRPEQYELLGERLASFAADNRVRP
ncbi:MAG: pyridoxal phosphate-dependent aminotransferase [Alistipes sp.]|jgi:aspartate/methionine/tyrosine aminotransferase|nr:pyridoxal phosphate-dependent aminotransferase [Alistipes sp.]